MVRLAAAVLAVLVLPPFVSAQQAPTHTVVKGDTLWELAQQFYGNPFDWRQIWEANRAEIQDPNLILPGQVLNIPDGATTTAAAAADDRARVDVSVEDVAGPSARPGPGESDRTLFYRDPDQRTGVVATSDRDFVVVPRDVAYSAPWLAELEAEPAHLGVLEGFAGGSQRSETPRSYDRIRISVEGSPPSVGTVLRAYRASRVIEDVGQVVIPTGLLTVTDVVDGAVVAVVTQEYDRIALGDLVGALPAYDLSAGAYPVRIMNGPAAMVMGFAGFNEVFDIGSVAFLDVGAEQGIVIGDEFEYLNPRAGSNVVEGRLQVVGVQPGVASARIVEMDDAVFQQGIVVRLTGKMR